MDEQKPPFDLDDQHDDSRMDNPNQLNDQNDSHDVEFAGQDEAAEMQEADEPKSAPAKLKSDKSNSTKQIRNQTLPNTEKRKKLSVKGLVILLSAASVAAAWLMNDSWSVRSIAVEGNHFTTSDAIIKAANMAPATKPDSLQALQVISRIEKLPYIAEARLEPNPPGAVKIVVIERQPIALLNQGNSFAVLDNKGVKMPVVAGKVPDLPLVYGFSASSRDTLKGKAFETVVAFLKSVNNDDLAKAAIGEIGFDTVRGIVAISQRNNVKLYFGHDQFDTRLKSLHAFYSQIARSRGLESFEWIDFRFEHQVITKELS